MTYCVVQLDNFGIPSEVSLFDDFESAKDFAAKLAARNGVSAKWIEKCITNNDKPGCSYGERGGAWVVTS